MTPGLLEMRLGTEAAMERDEEWCAMVRSFVQEMPAGRRFTSDDVTSKLGMPRGITRNATGAVFHHLSKEGIIASTGEITRSRRKERRGAWLQIWRRT